jgi:MFS family permease
VKIESDEVFETERAGHSKASGQADRRIVMMLMAIAMFSHMNRLSISTAGEEIMAQHGIDPTTMGWVYSAFLWTYTFCMVPGGLVIDRIGPRASLMMVLFSSAAFMAATGAVGFSLHDASSIVLGLVIVRSTMGVLSAPLHPACARAVGQWVPPSRRSRANGLVNGAALLGIAATPPGFGALIGWFDWPTAFLIMGGATALVGLIWTAGARDRPSAGESPHAFGDLISPAAWVELVRRPGLLLLTLSYGAVGYYQYMLFYWMSYYFKTVLELPTERSHFYAAIPPLAMALGMPFGGWLADRVEHARRTPVSRRIVPMLGASIGAVLLALGVLSREPVWIVTLFALSLGAVGMAEGPYWSTAIELGGHRGGSAAAVLNFGGNAVGLLAPIFTPWIGRLFTWSYAVDVGALICLVGGVLWLWIEVPPSVHVQERVRA